MATRFDKNLLSRFWGNVNKDGYTPLHCPELGPCWIWTGAVSGSGYGVLWTGKKLETVHRLSWEIHGNDLPKHKKNGRVEIYILHHCDNPVCVRESHLFSGTSRDNSLDSMRKLRHTCGERNSHAILTEQQVIQLREAFKNTRVAREAENKAIQEWRFLVRSFKISNQTALGVAYGRLWKHIPL
jgi:hypothetical protein